jgi:hypothetical protein
MWGWARSVRPEDGAPGRFRWALVTTRPANVAATAYVLGGLAKMGILGEVWTGEDRAAGAAWIRSMCIGGEQYRDPALMGRRTPGWPEAEPWPSPAMLNGLNGYARSVLNHCISQEQARELPPLGPPPGWPQPEDGPAAALDWIRTRPWDNDAWGAGSHAMRMARWMLQWHKEGRIPLEPVVAALRFFYDIQDPDTGLWGARALPKYNRINGTFKLFPLIREQLDLPLPRAARIIDEVIAEFERPDYDRTVGACDEWDNWYVIALAAERAPGHRRDEIRHLAARRIARVLEIFAKPDGGLSYHPAQCATNWIGFDMAPDLPQGDAMGPGVLAPAVSVCIALLGLDGATAWSGRWRMHADARESDALRQEIISRLDLRED